MIVTLQNGEKYRYSFQHITSSADLYYELCVREDRPIYGEDANRTDIFTKALGVTLVYIGKVGEEPQQPVAFSLCKADERQYDPEVGRRHALTKGLKNLNFDRDARARFWENYRASGNRWKKKEQRDV